MYVMYACSSTTKFHHFCLVLMSPILVTKRLVTNLLTRSSRLSTAICLAYLLSSIRIIITIFSPIYVAGRTLSSLSALRPELEPQ